LLLAAILIYQFVNESGWLAGILHQSG
jgi:hypothetical protein